MTFNVPGFVAMLMRRGARFDWVSASEFYLNLDRVEVDEDEELSIRWSMVNHYNEVRAHLFAREPRH
jgi:hypothetical protein